MRSAGTMLGVLLWLSLTSAQCFSGYGIAKLQAFAPFVSVYTSQKQPCTCPGQVVARQLQERTRSLRGLLILRAAEGGTKDDREDDIFSDDFPSYNNVGDDDTGQSSLLSLPPVFDTTEVLMIPVSSIRTRTHPHAPSHSPFTIAHTFTHIRTRAHTHNQTRTPPNMHQNSSCGWRAEFHQKKSIARCCAWVSSGVWWGGESALSTAIRGGGYD